MTLLGAFLHDAAAEATQFLRDLLAFSVGHKLTTRSHLLVPGGATRLKTGLANLLLALVARLTYVVADLKHDKRKRKMRGKTLGGSTTFEKCYHCI